MVVAGVNGSAVEEEELDKVDDETTVEELSITELEVEMAEEVEEELEVEELDTVELEAGGARRQGTT